MKTKKEKFQIFSKKENAMVPCDGYDVGTICGFEWFVHKVDGRYRVSEKISGMCAGMHIRFFNSQNEVTTQNVVRLADALKFAPVDVEWTCAKVGHAAFYRGVLAGQDKAKAAGQ